MKYLARKDSLCIKCHQCEEICSKAFFKTDNVEKSCIRITEEIDKVIVACNQCGICIDICPVKAITRDSKGIVRINKKECVGCFMCVGFCPEAAMRQHDDYIEPFKCIACGLCAKQCPTEAIYIEEKAKEQVAAISD
ncbi:Fe-S-cluster-containing dehydrogenase component [Anaerovirgula multivorans]|uniref:Fe-S-cluster-containing dehydrogenase component n=1 Tax=Anaerovirgula multivorans TaxID=312168 RepID=A0A239GC12_9FIRM|nr:4Fe-4S dicluster domain-containing protein [Anaerovirgula multivorans]SNS66003.1 Fe-S-cluster-containing dehydrogenase component [Anaerovirgula multivorans]